MAKRERKRKEAAADPVTQYARDVIDGKIVAGRLVRLACERHLRDIQEGSKRGLTWRPDLAEKHFAFVRCLELADPEGGGTRPFEFSPHQKFINGSIFGWTGPDGYRRFHTAYIEEAKGNGKTPQAAATGLFGLVADGEQEAEIYSAAVGRDQAKICFNDADRFVSRNRALRRRIVAHSNNLAFPNTHSFFRPVSSEGRGLDGKRVHIAIIDELHEHPSAVVVDKMSAGTKGRLQALIYEITNSGWDRHSVCYQHHDYTVKVLEGILEDDSWFGFIAAVDEDDDPIEDESCWEKANPNLGVSVTREYLRKQVREAKGMPAKRNLVLRLNFCVWTEQDKVWIPDAKWKLCGGVIDTAALRGRTCFGGLDLSSTDDITALVLDFPMGEGSHIWLPFFWIPEDNVEERVKKHRVPYDVWIRKGLMMTTPGNVIDYGFIRAHINDVLAPQYRIQEIALDRLFQSAQMSTDLQADGHTVVAFGQGFLSMAAPCKQLEEIVLGRKLNHGNNDVLRWMNSNVAIQQDPAGNKKMDKARSRDKIDGMVAGAMALGRATANGAEGPSVYEQRGVVVI
jgi:phage terminase large subunit-like protein